MTAYQPDPRLLDLGPEFSDPVRPADFPTCTPRFVNRRWSARVGLNLSESDWARHFCRFDPLPDNLPEPLALRYHGHQFRVYNPDIGDGRGFTFAQLRDDRGRLLDLGTKGSGQTPYSRHADGRLTLKGGVREVFATEMLEALGVNTSKTFALFETGEQLERGDEPSPTRSAVLTRLGHGHIRIGTFQRLAFFGQAENIKTLVRYCLEHLFGEPGDDPLRLFDLASARTAELAASYLAAGFVHGVLNSDNINVTGESFDYGPWRFTPDWDPDFTAAYFDHYGLYSFARQPEAIHWDLAQLAGCLSLIAEAPALSDMLGAWSERFDRALTSALCRRLGVADDARVASALLKALASREATIDRIFFDWRGGRDPGVQAYPSPPFRELAALLDGRARPPSHPYWSGPGPCSMIIEEVEAIWSAIATSDDWQPFEDKVKAIRNMGEAMAQDAPAA
ncbi:YdiU family protein [Sphingomonas lutea]|uniref:YdiU family protein n=1 Tax=Sphingomonas lutea TaxID=1045317 RepID=A0A7G9SGU4_9SPHN|nr:YdiU family protein [Sphingomonas lutea]QNN67069.1 YdiU family protein [Sphingomonas lutea]